MTDFFATISGARAQKLDLFVGQRGPWYIDAVLDDMSDEVSGAVTVQLGTLVLKGTVVPAFSGSFVSQRSLRVVAGGGGWGTWLNAKAYHNDAGLKATTIAQDAAREAGEVLGSIDFGPASLGPDFVRPMGPASVVLDRLLEPSGGQWWVDQNGITQCGKRPTFTPAEGSYQLLNYSPLQRTANLAVDDPVSLWVGAILTDRLSEPQTVRQMVLHVDRSTCRVEAFTGGDSSDGSRFLRALEALLEQREAKRKFGKYRYRVFAMNGNRANLQAVRRVVGLPDVLPVTFRPGTAGSWAKLQAGAEVLIEFIEGDPAQPICTGFAGKDDAKYLPESLELCVAPGETGKPVAGLGDTVDVFFPPAVPISGTVTIGGEPSPFTGVATITTSAPGIISTGSSRVTRGD